MKPLAIDLFCGLGGWSDGLIAESWHCIGFDIEQHEYWVPDRGDDGELKNAHIGGGSWFTPPPGRKCLAKRCPDGRVKIPGDDLLPRKLLRYPGSLVLQDVLTLHGSQFRDADLIVASPPCQAYSYRAMPWKRAKALPPPDNTLFESCFRIQREACEAVGRHIPMIVENVRGAQKWVGRARWNYGSFYLWGDVPALMPLTAARKAPAGTAWFNDAPRTKDSLASMGGKSHARKAASAMIAKIPAPLARHIGRSFYPTEITRAA